MKRIFIYIPSSSSSSSFYRFPIEWLFHFLLLRAYCWFWLLMICIVGYFSSRLKFNCLLFITWNHYPFLCFVTILHDEKCFVLLKHFENRWNGMNCRISVAGFSVYLDNKTKHRCGFYFQRDDDYDEWIGGRWVGVVFGWWWDILDFFGIRISVFYYFWMDKFVSLSVICRFVTLMFIFYFRCWRLDQYRELKNFENLLRVYLNHSKRFAKYSNQNLLPLHLLS